MINIEISRSLRITDIEIQKVHSAELHRTMQFLLVPQDLRGCILPGQENHPGDVVIYKLDSIRAITNCHYIFVDTAIAAIYIYIGIDRSVELHSCGGTSFAFETILYTVATCAL